MGTGRGNETAAKGELRGTMLARRRAIPAERRRAAAEAVAARLFAAPELAAARRVFSCLSFGDELDLWPIVERLLAEGRELYVPRTTRRDPVIHVHRYPCALETLSFGLVQPRRGEPKQLPPVVPPLPVVGTLTVR